MIRVWLARTPARLIEKVKTTHFFEAKVCPNGPKWTFSDGAGPGSRPKCQNDTLFWTKSVSILMEIKEIGPKTYSNSYKKLMVLRKWNRIEKSQGQNGRKSWKFAKMCKTTHFFSQKVCRFSEIQRNPTSREVKQLHFHFHFQFQFQFQVQFQFQFQFDFQLQCQFQLQL